MYLFLSYTRDEYTVNAWLRYRRHCDSLNRKDANLRHSQAAIAECLIAVGRKPVGRPYSFEIQPSKTKQKHAKCVQPDPPTKCARCRHCALQHCPQVQALSSSKELFFLSFIVPSAMFSLCLNKDRNYSAAYHM